MTEDDVRALVRRAIHDVNAAQNVARGHGAGSMPGPLVGVSAALLRQHTSHAQFAVPVGADVGGPCVIEPGVTCNHCGYCRSYGH